MALRLFFAALLAITLGWSAQCMAGVSAESFGPDDSRWLVNISGTVSQTTLVELQRTIGRKTNSAVLVSLDSNGGDWYAAIAIGYLLRKVNALVTIDDGKVCLSACVMVLAGGTRRNVLGRVGIHRPYSTETAPKSYKDAQQNYRVLEDLTRSFITEMNLPVALFDAMVAVPPESLHALSREELSRYGLSNNDPVAQQIDDADEARKYGLTMREYLVRKARRDQTCDSASMPDSTGEAVKQWYRCREAIMRGVK